MVACFCALLINGCDLIFWPRVLQILQMLTTLLDDFIRTSDPRVFILEDTLEASGEAILSFLRARFPGTENISSLTEGTVKGDNLRIFDPTMTFLADGKSKDLLKASINFISNKQIPATIIILHTDMLSLEELLDFRHVIGSWVTVLGSGDIQVNFKLGNKSRIQSLRVVETADSFSIVPNVAKVAVVSPLNELAEQSTFNIRLTREQAAQRQSVELPHLSAQSTPSSTPYTFASEGEDSQDES